jgi:hypothetical protein
MRHIRIATYNAALLLCMLNTGCGKQATPVLPAETKPTPYQRFVPVPPPQINMSGVPWTGYVALDTKTGMLCLTAGNYVPEKFKDLPICNVLRTLYAD